MFSRKGYVVERRLSRGAYGEVYRGTNSKTGKLFALKTLNLDKLGPNLQKKFLPRELATLMTVRHAHMAHIHDIMRSCNQIYIFMEFGNCDLSGYIKAHGAIDEPQTAIWFGQVASALYYLHIDMRLAHRDIKIDNVLLFGDDNQVAKLIDFGFAQECWDWDQGRPLMSKTWCGTPPYYSPQIVECVPYNSFASDCWAMGIFVQQ